MPEAAHKQVILSHSGEINYDNIGVLLTKLREVMNSYGFKLSSYKKVLSVMVECLENIYKYIDHLDIEPQRLSKHESIFKLTYLENSFLLETGNIIQNEDINNVKDKIDRVNSLDEKDLKKLYKKIITNGQFTKKGGAGLGFIEIIKTTGEKIDYSFQDIDDNYSYYRIKIFIPVS